MKNKNKELLFKDICCRLPYGVKAYVRNYSKLDRKWYEGTYTIKSVFPVLNEIFVTSEKSSVEVLVGYDDYEIKPYLFPLSSMTEVQKNIYSTYIDELKRNDGTYFETIFTSLQFWLYANHFDVHGLIPLDLAIDATNKNIY